MADRSFHELMIDDYVGRIDAPDLAPTFVWHLIRDVTKHYLGLSRRPSE